LPTGEHVGPVARIVAELLRPDVDRPGFPLPPPAGIFRREDNDLVAVGLELAASRQHRSHDAGDRRQVAIREECDPRGVHPRVSTPRARCRPRLSQDCVSSSPPRISYPGTAPSLDLPALFDDMGHPTGCVCRPSVGFWSGYLKFVGGLSRVDNMHAGTNRRPAGGGFRQSGTAWELMISTPWPARYDSRNPMATFRRADSTASRRGRPRARYAAVDASSVQPAPWRRVGYRLPRSR